MSVFASSVAWRRERAPACDAVRLRSDAGTLTLEGVTFEEHPELAEYDPQEQPLRGRRRTLAARVFVVVALSALLLPGILLTISIQTQTAEYTCTVYAKHFQPDAVGSSARFELFAPAGPGWQCYALNTEGDATFVAPLGLIPSAPHALP